MPQNANLLKDCFESSQNLRVWLKSGFGLIWCFTVKRIPRESLNYGKYYIILKIWLKRKELSKELSQEFTIELLLCKVYKKRLM